MNKSSRMQSKLFLNQEIPIRALIARPYISFVLRLRNLAWFAEIVSNFEDLFLFWGLFPFSFSHIKLVLSVYISILFSAFRINITCEARSVFSLLKKPHYRIPSETSRGTELTFADVRETRVKCKSARRVSLRKEQLVNARSRGE